MPGGPIAPRPSEVRLRTTDVQPPAALYVTQDDQLRLQTVNAAAGITIELSLRLLLPNGEIIPQREIVRPAATRTVEEFFFRLPECFLLSAMITSFGAGLLRGQTFVQAQLVRGVAGDLSSAHILASDYVSSSEAIAWPGGTQRNSLEDRGNFRSITGTDPAAGAEISETVPTNAVWRLMSLRFRLVAAAGGGDRVPTVLLDDGANVFAGVEAPAGHAAAVTRDYTYACGLVSRAAVAAEAICPLPCDLYLREGSRIRTSTNALAGGDNYGAPQMLVEEWLQT